MPLTPAPCLIAVAIVALPWTAEAARVDYIVDVGVERNDNVTLASGDGIHQSYLRGGLGFVVSEDTSAIQAQIEGRADYRNYQDDIFGDTVDGTLSGRVNWIAIPRRLFFTVEDSLTTQSVDALAPNAPGNRQQVNVFSAGPTLLLNWSDTFHGQMELRYVDTDAEVTDEFNSTRVALALRTVKELSPMRRVSMNLQGQRVDFDDDIVARDYDRYDLFARYVHAVARIEMGMDVGYSRLAYRDGSSRSEPLVRIDASWNPSSRSRWTLAAASEFSDTATAALGTIQSDATVPENVLTGDAVVNASPYEMRGVDLGYAYSGARLSFSVTPFVQERDYVESDTFDQKTRGVRGDIEFLIRPSLGLEFYGSHEVLDYTQLGRRDETQRIGSRLRYEWTRHWSAALLVERYRRDSTEVGQSTSQNVVYLSVTYSNR